MKMEERKRLFLEALGRSGGVVAEACIATGIGRSTYYRWYAEDCDFREAADDIAETQIDFVESKLLRAINNGDVTATIFYLKTKGKKRGYSDKAQPAAMPDAGAAASPLPASAALPGHVGADGGHAGSDGEQSKAIAAKVKSKKAYIVKLLKEQGKYTSELIYQVDITAKLLVRADLLGDEILSDGHHTVSVEYSREGNERMTLNPKEKLYIELLEKGQKALRALGMNTESKERKGAGDTFGDFLASMREEGDE